MSGRRTSSFRSQAAQLLRSHPFILGLSILDQSQSGENRRENNFGLLRLLLAALVVVSHSPEIIDGNRSREILTRLFGTLSFGDLAVDGFFLISGYLITKSFVQTNSVMLYLLKRLVRIVPGYAICFVACILLLAPLVGAESLHSVRQIGRIVFDFIFLLPPRAPGAFSGLHYPALNGPMWTIAYEFRCYVAVAALGLLGFFHSPSRRFLLLFAVSALLILNAFDIFANVHPGGAGVFGTPQLDLRFGTLFGTGSIYYLFQKHVSFTSIGALASGVLLAIMMFSRELAEFAVCIFGGYLLFWSAFKIKVSSASRLANKIDISYGLYLYAWPVQSLIVFNYRDVNPWLLCLMTFAIAGCLAYVSWVWVERPCMRLVNKERSLARGR